VFETTPKFKTQFEELKCFVYFTLFTETVLFLIFIFLSLFLLNIVPEEI